MLRMLFVFGYYKNDFPIILHVLICIQSLIQFRKTYCYRYSIHTNVRLYTCYYKYAFYWLHEWLDMELTFFYP
jgi:hypothetical protein